MVRRSDSSNPPLLVGREREQRELGVLLDAAFAGQGRLVLVSGEAGIGKTALVDYLVQTARQRAALALTGACYDLTTTPPYGAWVEMARGYPHDADSLPRLPDFLQSDQGAEQSRSQSDLFEQVGTFLIDLAAQTPLVLLLEDLHWSDDAGLDLLRYIARHTADARLLLVVTYRDDEMARRHPLYQMMPLLVREAQAQRIELRRLDTTAVQQWIVARYQLLPDDERRLVQYLEIYAEGNPLYIGEVLRTLEAERLIESTTAGWRVKDLSAVYIPPLLRQVIDGRLQRLEATTRDALTLAAVIGDEVPLDVWEAVGGLEPAALDRVIAQALDSHVLVEPPGHQGLRFSHALVREVLYGGITPTRRRVHHRAVAETLEQGPHPDPDAVAYHFQQAGDARALAWLLRAGLQARRSAAWFAAAERFEAAAAMLEHDPPQARLRAWLLFWVVFLRRYSRSPRSAGYLDEVARLAQITNDPLLPAYLQHIHGMTRGFRGEIRRALEDTEAAALAFDEVARTHPVPPIDVMPVTVIEEWLSTQGAVPYPVSTPPFELADGTPRVSQQRGVLVIWLSHAGNYRRARQQGEVFIAQVTAAFGDRHLQRGPCVSGHAGLGHAYAALGFPEEAHRELTIAREAFAVTGDYGMENYSAWLELLVVTIPYRADRIAEREELLSIAEQAWNRSIGMTMTVAHPDHARLLIDILEGRWSEARKRATEGLTPASPDRHQSAVVNLGILARDQGEPDLAWQQVLTLLPEGPETEPGNSWFAHSHPAQRLAAELALDAKDLDLAGRWIEAHGHWQEWSGAVLWQPHHQLLQARYYRLSGNIDAACQHAERALALASDPRQPLALAAAHRLLGEIETQRGQFDAADDHLEAALGLAVACAAPFERSLSLLALAELQVAINRCDEARTLLAEVRTICTPLEARPTLERVDALEIEISAQASSAPTYPDGLTEREVEVLHLIAAGKSNREMAELLYITTRTVERHIANIYLKIDAHNRVEAAAYAARHNLTAPPSA